MRTKKVKRRRRTGPTARSRRTHEAIVNALIDLLEAGNMRPRAAEIARRARVSRRTVFKHFPQTELMRGAAAEVLMQRQAAEFAPVRRALDRPFARRLAAFVGYRARLFERVSPIRRAAAAFAPFSQQTTAGIQRAIRESRDEVALVFSTELASFKPARRREVLGALSAVCSWPFWEAMRQQQNLSRASAQRLLASIAARLLDPGASGRRGRS